MFAYSHNHITIHSLKYWKHLYLFCFFFFPMYYIYINSGSSYIILFKRIYSTYGISVKIEQLFFQ